MADEKDFNQDEDSKQDDDPPEKEDDQHKADQHKNSEHYEEEPQQKMMTEDHSYKKRAGSDEEDHDLSKKRGEKKQKKRRRIKKRAIALIMFIFMVTSSVLLFWFVEHNLDPALKEIGKTYAKQRATLAINDAIYEKVIEEMDEFEELYSLVESGEGDLQFIAFNRVFHARLVTAATDRANEILIGLEKEPISVPLGQALDSNILAQLGPDVPIKLVPIGAAGADVYLEMQEAGINTVAIVSRLVVEADVRIVIPFTSVEAHVETEVPVSIDVLPGDIPQYYFRSGHGHGSESSRSISLPTISLPRSDE